MNLLLKTYGLLVVLSLCVEAQPLNPTTYPYGGVPNGSRREYFSLKDPIDFRLAADFKRAHFYSTADFVLATFHSRADFEGVTFDSTVDFRTARFRSKINFIRAEFHGPAYFREATFDSTADFEEAAFESTADFEGATFEKGIDLQKASFRDTVVRFFKSNVRGSVCCVDIPGNLVADFTSAVLSRIVS